MLPDDAGTENPIIALVDERELTRHCVERWLAEAWPEHHILAVSAARELGERARVQRGTMRFALLGVSAGRVVAPSTLAIIAQLRRDLGQTPVMILGEGEAAEDVRAAIRAGARGYIPMSLGRAAAVEAIRFVLAGGTFVPAGVIEEGQGSAQSGSQQPPVMMRRLSPRELAVAEHLRQGRPNKLIAYELSISESTVKIFVRRILTKLGAANRTEAALLIDRLLPNASEVQERSA